MPQLETKALFCALSRATARQPAPVDKLTLDLLWSTPSPQLISRLVCERSLWMPGRAVDPEYCNTLASQSGANSCQTLLTEPQTHSMSCTRDQFLFLRIQSFIKHHLKLEAELPYMELLCPEGGIPWPVVWSCSYISSHIFISHSLFIRDQLPICCRKMCLKIEKDTQ